MKTRALSLILLLSCIRAGAEGFSAFACLRDLMPLTERGTYQSRRGDVERPFVAGEKYIVFPEVRARRLTGFYVYDQNHAYYYDTIETRTEASVKSLPIAGLESARERPFYQMVAQPAGLETVTIHYMPGFNARETNSNGPVILGTSVLPVIGALMSRPEKYDYVYQNPKDVPDGRLQDWLAQNKGGRSPASRQKIERRLVRLVSRFNKEEKSLWKPLKEELRLRRDWIRDHNIDNHTFKEISRVMEGSCRQ